MQPCSINPGRGKVARSLNDFRQGLGLPFSKAFSPQVLNETLRDEGQLNSKDNGPFPAHVTLFAFMSQVLDGDPSCSAAVARVNADRLTKGLSPCSPHTSSYCKARKRLPVGVFKCLASQCADALQAEAKDAWLWRNRQVKIVDGTTLTAPDTVENRETYPQHHNYRAGLGFPTVRVAALTSLATGAIIDVELGPSYGRGSGETSLAHRLLRSIAAGDVVVGDRYYGGFPFIAAVRAIGADFVGRIKTKSRKILGSRLGKGDHLVVWDRSEKSAAMSADELQSLPDACILRQVDVTVRAPGQKARSLTLITTLLSAKEYPPDALAELYLQRWQIELDLRSIKQVMHMDRLRCLTPDMLEKEIWANILTYNIVRLALAQAGAVHGILPRRLSFKAALQNLRSFQIVFLNCPRRLRSPCRMAMLEIISRCRVPDRPGRSEPRQIKWNPKKYDLLKVPRQSSVQACR